MRWSLILSALIVVQSALSAVCVALAIRGTSSEELERRTPSGAKIPSKEYRENSKQHHYVYVFHPTTGSVTRGWLDHKDRVPNGEKVLNVPNTDADHVFEHQMLKKHLVKHKLRFEDLHPDLRKEVTKIINDPKNMAPVPAGVNRGKGQVIRHGMNGKGITPKEPRDGYLRLSYGTARKTAKELDKTFKKHKHGHDFKGHTFHKFLRQTMEDAKILTHGSPSPASSRSSSPVANGRAKRKMSDAAAQPSPKRVKQTRKSPRNHGNRRK